MSSLAIADSTELTTIDEEQLVTMMVDNQLFGIPILKVQDIVEPEQITPVPCAPSAIAGVLNLRGRIVTVIDLRELLGARDSEKQRQMSVTVEHKGDLYTLLVDSIGDVRSLPKKDFDTPPATLDENMRRLCSGIIHLEDNLLVVLDVNRILDEETIMKTPRRTRRRRVVKPAARTADADSDGESAPAPEAANDEPQAVRTERKPESTARDDVTGPAPVKSAKAANDAARKPPPTPKPAAPAAASAGSLFDDLGGAAKVSGYAAQIFDALMSDPTVSHFADGQDHAAVKEGFCDLAAAAVGGAAKGSMDELKAILHVLVREEGLDDDHFIALAKHANEILSNDRAPAMAVHAVLELVDGLRNELVVH